MSVLVALLFAGIVIASWTAAGLLLVMGVRTWRALGRAGSAGRNGGSGIMLSAAPVVPDMGAFLAGLELQIFIVLFTIASVVIVNWIIGIMRSSG